MKSPEFICYGNLPFLGGRAGIAGKVRTFLNNVSSSGEISERQMLETDECTANPDR
jgi:hypothetical protein